MGTNFYWIVERDVTPLGDIVAPDYHRDEPEVHIGLRSASGLYCYTCKAPVPSGSTCCQYCGREREPDAHNAAKMALGLEEPPTSPLAGVHGSSLFIWAQQPQPVLDRCRESLFRVLMVDDSGREYRGHEFIAMLDLCCPVQRLDSINMWFS